MARKKIGRKKVAQRKLARRKRGSFSREKKLAVVRAHKAGIPASKLGSELGIKPINIYLWTREVKKKGEAKAFQRVGGGLTLKQARLLRAAKLAK
jgi:transposase-like protein